MDNKRLRMCGDTFRQSHSSEIIEPLMKKRLCISYYIRSQLYLQMFDREDLSSLHKIVLDGFYSMFHADKSTIYLSEESEDSRCRHVYKYELPENDSEIPKVLNKTNVTSAPPLRYSKLCPATIGYGEHILIFSTILSFGDGGNVDPDNPHFDFEIYDPKGIKSRILPQLCIRHDYSDYELVDPTCESSVPFSVNGCSASWSSRFGINGSCLFEGHTLVVQTDFGQSFSLLLSSENAKWDLFSHKDLDLGILLHHESQFFVKDGFYIDAYGAYRMQKHERKEPNYDRPTDIDRGIVEEEDEDDRCGIGFVAEEEDNRRVPFGLTVEFLQSSVMTFCDDDDDVACHVQVSTDWEVNNPVLSIHLLKFDFSKFPEKKQESREELHLQEWVKPVKYCHIPLDIQIPRWGNFPFHLLGVFSI